MRTEARRLLASSARAAIVCTALVPAMTAAEPVEQAIEVVLGVTEAGTAVPRWSAVLEQRLPPDRYREALQTRRPLGEGERAWLTLVRSRATLWEGERATLERPYAGVRPPGSVAVVVGNQAARGDDAFTHDATTIGFDLGELHAAYGDAARPENTARIDRFFRHEYAHLLQRAWLSAHPWPSETPQARALLEIWKEGLGNYHSLSERWTEQGRATPLARDTLAALEPRLVARLSALACATPQQAPALTAGLSRGPFDRKWGALPVALWLATEPDVEQGLRDFVQGGPSAVWSLAARRLDPALARVLAEARDAAASCAERAGTE